MNYLLNEHMQRLGKSAAYFDVPLDMHAVFQGLDSALQTLDKIPHRIRLLVSRDGNSEIQTFSLDEGRAGSPGAPRTARRSVPPLRIAVAKEPVDSSNFFLYHKTTHRKVYESAKAGFPDADDVILWNENGEVTESCLANVIIRKAGKLITPPVTSGLLAGTFRDHLLKTGEIEESVVSLADLKAAEEVFLVNSVRKWQKAVVEQQER